MKRYVDLFIVLTSGLFFLICGALFAGFAYFFSDTCNTVIPTPISNARGDSAEENLQICTGIGTVTNYSITLQLRGATAPKTLVKYAPPSDRAPPAVLRWLNDDALIIDLGKVNSVWSKIEKVGSIHITYSYTVSDGE